jgi:hypothetical protein
MPASSPLFVLHDDPGVLRSVQAARPRAVRCAGWNALRHAVAAAPPTAQVLVDAYQTGGHAPADALRDFLLALPSVSVVATLAVEPLRMRDVQTLGAWGVAEVAVLPAEEGPAALDRILARCRGRAFVRAFSASVPRYASPRASAMMLVAAHTAHAGGGARSLGRALALGRAALAAACWREGLPRPGRLVRWMRALVAAHQMDDPARTPALVARSCGFRTEAALRAGIASVTGDADPTPGSAFALAAAAFHAETRALREAARERARARMRPPL